MRRIIAIAAVTTTVATGALAASASAHTISVRPRSDFIESTFFFTGRAWQPNNTVRWYYDQFNNGSFNQQGRFTVPSSGNFTFRWGSNDAVGEHRLCFQQYDSRRRYRRYFTACARYETFDFVDR
jgi:hypothetical protein